MINCAAPQVSPVCPPICDFTSQPNKPAISIIMARQEIIYKPQRATIGIQITAAATNDVIESSPASLPNPSSRAALGMLDNKP